MHIGTVDRLVYIEIIVVFLDSACSLSDSPMVQRAGCVGLQVNEVIVN